MYNELFAPLCVPAMQKPKVEEQPNVENTTEPYCKFFFLSFFFRYTFIHLVVYLVLVFLSIANVFVFETEDGGDDIHAKSRSRIADWQWHRDKNRIGDVNFDSNDWYMVVVHHKGSLGKRQILNNLFSIIADDSFFPVCYTVSGKVEPSTFIFLIFLLPLPGSEVCRLFSC